MANFGSNKEQKQLRCTRDYSGSPKEFCIMVVPEQPILLTRKTKTHPQCWQSQKGVFTEEDNYLPVTPQPTVTCRFRVHDEKQHNSNCVAASHTAGLMFLDRKNLPIIANTATDTAPILPTDPIRAH